MTFSCADCGRVFVGRRRVRANMVTDSSGFYCRPCRPQLPAVPEVLEPCPWHAAEEADNCRPCNRAELEQPQ